MAPRLISCFRPKKDSTTRQSDPAATADEAAEEQRRGGGGGNGPVLVELFSSQGCKTSTEAELVMSRLGRGDFNLDRPIIVLGFHVDYWDYIGWKDPFGSSQWTVRQKAYVEALRLDTMFTPQFVVQGRAQCVGNEEESVLSHIASAPSFPPPSFQVWANYFSILWSSYWILCDYYIVLIHHAWLVIWTPWSTAIVIVWWVVLICKNDQLLFVFSLMLRLVGIFVNVHGHTIVGILAVDLLHLAEADLLLRYSPCTSTIIICQMKWLISNLRRLMSTTLAAYLGENVLLLYRW